ncbi:MAG TPA: sigma-70 family RNA polymerase sigma factor [Planctomycetota bacterium]|nr:sigma-70 family RNA polymerase sigma factor [Planctomycetota bacterium]
MAEREDDDLVLEARGGSASAMETLYRRHAPRLLAYALRVTGDRDLAEDVVQETFAWFFRNLERYEPQGKLAAYLFRIAHSTATDEAVAARKARRAVDRRSPIAEAPDDPLGELPTAERVQAALAALPAHLREVVVLRLFQGLDYAAVGEATGVSEATARSRMRYALAALRGALHRPAEDSAARGDD